MCGSEKKKTINISHKKQLTVTNNAISTCLFTVDLVSIICHVNKKFKNKTF